MFFFFTINENSIKYSNQMYTYTLFNLQIHFKKHEDTYIIFAMLKTLQTI